MKRKKKLEQEDGINKKICQNCQRVFWPKTDSDTCLLCQQGLIVKTTIKSEPEKPDTSGFRTCLRCLKEFESAGIYNRICPNCRNSNANVSVLAEPNYPYKLSDTNG
ncbi:MAG: hypothetical protein A2Y82_02275 [Candidatus Buchananbacteria bacterium RBG_13_36_9]|uniref:Uncharacterized protein n=1 Tax=Candidatus Buchananbacteria bacterium RBG_13_36_9 TaxID=1797530 RepID=A0A1G1XR48_9BACT|nr:MAG: hypothetical protein A2Y82_02275 [Candidatus Buchananbacteria bacterium RBG_13_36_9]